MPGEERKFDVHEREQAIFNRLREIDSAVGASVRELHDHLTNTGVELVTSGGVVRDTVTVQAYHKLVARLVLDGRLVEVQAGGADAQRYALAPALHADTAFSLDDIDQLLEELKPTEAIAALIDAREYVHGSRKGALREAALALQKVPPRDLVRDVILAKVELYNADVAAWQAHGGDDEPHRRRLKAARTELENLCYRWFGLSWDAVYVPPASSVSNSGAGAVMATVDTAHLDAELMLRVFGDSVIYFVQAANPSAPGDWTNVVVAGSDGSTYSSVMSIDTAKAFVDDGGSEVVTFNNSLAYLHMEGLNRQRHPSRVYSVPITRSAIDSPTNAGMVMAPFMFRDLTEGEYEHMAKCATDVVQWRADERVFVGDAPAMGGDGRLLPAPRVHLRDGTVTLQEREANHYQRNDAYGNMVRTGVQISHRILTHIRSRRQPPIFAGAVKGSQLHLFGTIINWFIKNGHPGSGTAPIDPGWDVSRGAMLNDNEAVTALLATLLPENPGDGFFCTFAVARPFHALTDVVRLYEHESPEFWVDKMRERQRDHLARPGMDSYWKTVDVIEDDPWVRMCEEADYVMFYIGHSGGQPLPLAPRYEFLESLRFCGPDTAASAAQATRQVRRNIELLVAALMHVKFSTDRDHNFLTGKRLVKTVPSVVYRAHELCKALGKRLETELKSAIVANLHRLGRARRATDDAVSLRPLSARRYFEVQARLRDQRAKEIESGNADQPE
ncbi:hypothetical protein FJK98_31590 [Micromonospora sp. HM134]|uniref:hypothetical protein n=1 Tax=Micromonospora sp. HM134 TaxID=2583243 RepID=UPI00119849ED|nr:hypothetical protein [Micromonospora sp. HM134]QDY11130.1 hypothetical protein FJK98_31590 [Micromonospora sp. HM134]